MCFSKGREEEQRLKQVGNQYHDLARQAMKKISDEGTKIYMLIDYQYWNEAIEEVEYAKHSELYEDYKGYLLDKAPKWVELKFREVAP